MHLDGKEKVTALAAAGRVRSTRRAVVPSLVETTAQLAVCTRPSSAIWAGRGQASLRVMNCGRRARNSSRAFGFRPLTPAPSGSHRGGPCSNRLATVAAWRDAPYFTDAERAALALTEAVTRLADRPDPVPDEIWDEAARHYDEEGLAALLLSIATTNVFNRLNVRTRQVAGAWS